MSALKTLKDLAESMISARDAKAFEAKKSEFQARIIDAQASVFEANEERSALIARVAQLEKQIAEMETWDAEKQRYELKRVSSFGTLAYALKEGMTGAEPAHLICATCYQRGKKSLLQGTPKLETGRRMYLCPECNTTIAMEG
jgi:hypothetical protein